MGHENGEWVMHGMAWDDPQRIPSWQALAAYIDEVGFLPLFQNEAAGFSVEEHVSPLFWWTGDPARDPWEWRELLARSGLVAYGKFFEKKAGFLSKKWFPYFAAWRRDGYDFDSRWDDELATMRSKKIMDCFAEEGEWQSAALRRAAGFGKGGEKNFDGVVTDLQMQTYLVIRDFRRRLNRQGLPYGWPLAVYTTPEALWDGETVTAAYGMRPEAALEQILTQAEKAFPDAAPEALRKVLGADAAFHC